MKVSTPAPIQGAQLHFDEQHNPSSPLFDDIYYARNQGIAESHHVFIQGNKLLQRWQDASTQPLWLIAETGFGTGLNFLYCAALFLTHAHPDAQLHFVSFEKHPLIKQDFHRIAIEHSPQWQNNQEQELFLALAQAFYQDYPHLMLGTHRRQLHPRITLELVYGDANQQLPLWTAEHTNTVDAWFLDGFAPTKNNDFWNAYLYRAIYQSTKANGTLATFTAAGHVRRGLQQEGFTVTKAPGFGHKRDMTQAIKRSLGQPALPAIQSVAIAGAGIAGACLAVELMHFPGTLQLIWGSDQAGDGASGNPQGAMYPHLNASWSLLSEFYCQAFDYAKSFYRIHAPSHLHTQGVLIRATDDTLKERHHTLVQSGYYPHELAQLQGDDVLLPQGSWVESQRLVQHLFEQVLSTRKELGLETQLLTQVHIESIHQIDPQHSTHEHPVHWRLQLAITEQNNKEPMRTEVETQTLETEHLLLALGNGLATLPVYRPDGSLYPAFCDAAPLDLVRGQVTQLRLSPEQLQQLEWLQRPVCAQAYVLPPQEQHLCVGATYQRNDLSTKSRHEDDVTNIKATNLTLGTDFQSKQVVSSRAGIRAMSPDHLPLLGGYPVAIDAQEVVSELPALQVMTGLGSRGFTSAPLLANVIGSQILHKPSPLNQRLTQALSSHRFIQKQQRRQP